jgi:hypothetical protein
VNSDHSYWPALIGCTPWARRTVAGAASEIPRCLTFPAATNSAIAPQVSSTGTVASTRCWW